MKYSVRTTERFDREFQKLDRYTQKMMLAWLHKHLDNCENPYACGKALTGNKSGLWRYRIGDYRMICKIEKNELIILALTVGHRSEIYKRPI